MAVEPSEPLLRAWKTATVLSMAAYIVLQILWIVATPIKIQSMPDGVPAGASPNVTTGIGPDEPQHLLYVLSVAEGRGLPRPDPIYRTSPAQYVTYVAQHPPLFYILAAGVVHVFRPLGDRAAFYALRVLCSLLGLGALWFISRAALYAFPNVPFIPLATPPFVALLPMFGYMTSVVSNVPLELFLTSAGWMLIVRLVRGGQPLDGRTTLGLAVTFGLAVLTRLTSIIWIPALAIAVGIAIRTAPAEQRRAVIGRAAAIAVTIVECLGAWSIHSKLTYGSLLFRWPYRPAFAFITPQDYLADPHQMIHTFHTTISMPLPPLTVALWNTSTAWVPFWIAESSLPGYAQNPMVAGSFQALFMIADIVALTLLLLNWMRRLREPKSEPDPRGRLLAWIAAGMTVLVALLVIQQQFWVDMMMIAYGGRYSLSAVAPAALLFVFALSTRAKPNLSSGIKGAIGVAVVMGAVDLWAWSLVHQFYTTGPG